MSKNKEKTILLVEDEEFLSDIYKTKLEKSGYRVVLAKNGEEGVVKAKEVLPDLIFLDIVMPKLNGFEVLKMIQEEPSTKDIKVCFLSNLSQANEGKDLVKDNVVGYFIKSNLVPNDLVLKAEEIMKEDN